ncbi:tetratricopeptide repeat protein [Streptomyces sp. NPDC001568]|uniref:tetratricopeptide repeat protein n=1 Tax=Streptomyces sp. NPDC001568 TaxID=3364588 RepID=UPI00369590FA
MNVLARVAWAWTRSERLSRGASSIGTGGGGTIYEYRVAALDLVSLLCGVAVPGLEVAPNELRLQQGSEFPLDDIVALSRQSSFQLVVERQVKRTLEIAPSSEPWRKTMRQCLQSLESFGDEIDSGRHRLGITASGPHKGLELLQSLAAYAAAQNSLDGLLRQLPNVGQDHHRLWKYLVDTISDLLPEGGVVTPGRESAELSAFRIARCLVVEIEPAEQMSPRYPYLCSLLEDRVLQTGAKHDSAAVYRMVEELAQEWGPRAGAVDAAMLRGRLQARGVALRGDPSSRGRVASHRVRAVKNLEPSDALRLEVHPSFDAEIHSGALTLPTYIDRPASLDDELRRQVAGAANGSRMVMVVGGSSTGKTRSCWEAVRAELPDWRIVHPLTPERPAALMSALQEGALEPRTVLWLNEANLYLLVKDYAAQASASLQALLTDPQRGPVLVLGTIWPDFWDKLTEHTFEGCDMETGMGAVHHLADLAVTVRMPTTFTSRDLARSASVIDSDARLQLARSRAVSGRITQFLAGAPILWSRYEQSTGAARAILHAAMDARRCGHGPLLSEDFLRVAAEGYIDDATWHALDEDWFDVHLAKLLKPIRQLPGPLSRFRPRPDEQNPVSRLYQLADYLHERSRATREKEDPAPSLWAAASAHSHTDTDVRELAQAARRMGAVSCELLYLKSAARGDVDVLQWFIRRLMKLSRFERAEELIEKYCLDGLLLGELSAAMGLAGRFKDAERLARRAYGVSRDRNGARNLAHKLLALGMHRPAERIYSWLVETGDPVAARWLTKHHEARGEGATAERLARTALAQYGDPSAALLLAQLRVTAGELDDADRLCRIAASHGHADVLVASARERLNHRDFATALCLYRAAATENHPKALEWMSWRCEGQGHHQSAEDLAHAAAAAGNSHALHGLAHLRFFHGRRHDAERLNRAAAQVGSELARQWLIRSGISTS